MVTGLAVVVMWHCHEPNILFPACPKEKVGANLL